MTKKETKSEQVSPTGALEALMKMQSRGLGSVVGAQIAWLESLGDIGAEVAEFVTDRIKEDVKFQHQILECDDLDEARSLQSAFIQTAVSQYQAETGKLTDMSLKALKVPHS